MIQKNCYYTLEETATMLAVSPATVRNWIRHEYLRPAGHTSNIMFGYEEVHNLHDKIRSGWISRCVSRANKVKSRRSFIPEEYLSDRSGRSQIEKAVSFIADRELDFDRAFFVLVLNRLFAEELSVGQDVGRFIRDGFQIPEKGHLSRELNCWYQELGRFRISKEYNTLLGIELPRQRDILGCIYQSLLREGDKAASGSYYTPDRIVNEIASMVSGNSRVLDPCCGTGQFLLAFAENIGDPGVLYGADIDGLAVRIARINLMLAFRDRDFEPHVYRSNFLQDGAFAGTEHELFDMIATNPPWGLHYSRNELDQLKKIHPEIKSFESFSYILKKSMELLRKSGRLSFILPESILHVKAHSDIRNYILASARIERIVKLGRVFKHVFTPVIRLDLIKGGGSGRLLYVSGGKINAVDQKRFMKNEGFTFDINIEKRDARIMDKAYGPDHTTLAGQADWALGIVTGNNRKFLSGDVADAGYEPICKGKDVGHYFLGEPTCFIKFMPEQFQQSAPEHKYRAEEKLIYRFISNNVILAYDNRGFLTLNSANILIPRREHYPIKAVLALFNSSLYQFMFQKKFSSIKVLRSHLEHLPLPLWDNSKMERLVSLADGVLDRRVTPEEVDEFVMNTFGLTEGEQMHVLKSISKK
jgi:predicted RNA methylase